jgi:hypothetical protein
MDGKIILEDSVLRIEGLRVTSSDVVGFFRQVEEPKRAEVAVSAIEVGVFCLQRAQLGASLDFVRLEVDRLIGAAGSAMAAMPDNLSTKLEGESGPLRAVRDQLDEVRVLFDSHLDPDRREATLGRALATLKELLDPKRDDSVQKRIETALSGVPEELRVKLEGDSGPLKTIREELNEVKGLFEQHLDPDRPEATLGRALGTLRTLIDPKHDDSVQKRIEIVLKEIAAEDGELATAVRKAVADGTNDLRTAVENLRNTVVGEKAEEAVIARTTEKGFEFEEELKPVLQQWSAAVGAESPEHVGPQNLPGDFVITLRDTTLAAVPLKIVIEARDRESGWGRARISEQMNTALSQWNGNCGIYISKDHTGLAREIGEWSELSCEGGPIVACVAEHVRTALRFLVVDAKLREAARARKEVDISTVGAQLGRFRAALNHLKQIKSSASAIDSGVQAIRTEADAMREEIDDAMRQIEAALPQ